MTAEKRMDVLEQRETTHGSYEETAHTSQNIKDVLRYHRKWLDLSPMQRESMEMIALKMSRILNGNPNELDHWKDIQGYAELVAEGLKPCSK